MEMIWMATRITLWVAGVVGCMRYFQLSPKYKLLTMYLLLGVATDLTGTYFENDSGYNLFLIPIYSLIELSIFSALYYFFFLEQKKRFLLFGIPLMLGFIVLDIFFLCDLFNAKTFYAFGKVISDFTIIGLCFFYYWKVLMGEQAINRELFILNTVFLSYFLINALIFLSINFLINEAFYLVDPFWAANALTALLLYAFLTYMIWQDGKTRKALHSGLL